MKASKENKDEISLEQWIGMSRRNTILIWLIYLMFWALGILFGWFMWGVK